MPLTLPAPTARFDIAMEDGPRVRLRRYGNAKGTRLLVETREIGVTRTNLIRCLMAAGSFKDAEREARIFIAVTPCAEAWSMLAAVHRQP